MESMNKLSNHLEKRSIELKKLKDKGIKLVGFSGLGYLPEEMIYASGSVPLRFIRGGDPEAVAASAAYIPRFVCPFARSQFGYRVLEEEFCYQIIDLFACAITCQHMRRVADLFDLYTDLDVFRLGVPHGYNTEQGLKY